MLTAGPGFAAALCAGAAAALLAGREQGPRRARALAAGRGPEPDARSLSPRGSWERWWPVVRARREWSCLVLAGVVAVMGGSPLPLLAGAGAVPLARRRLRARERARERARRTEAVIALCGTVAGELRAGWQPAQALFFAARSTGALASDEAAVLAAARFGGDVPEELRRAAVREGAEGLTGVAACWRVAVDGGVGLAAGLDRLEATLRERRDGSERLRARLAGAWATVALLAVLPVVGLVMGWALGADPLRVLLHTPAGLACLAVGGLLETVGLWWAGRVVRRGEAA
ncbi:type II secretion system F family protein [Streptomyces sp. SP18CS02]|uniref:type II secretion system F family protein n=1 Tax=Streptomyces sp. SP18CS02 TaxID=3002531 RepID=UPI002E76B463|nr:type II secretion system F family protein [Streptomyces sp. SP18CS02]MEE1756820.1 type II secretion system F family protein [Streptomyces sp. SP18CS02]